MIVAKEVLKKEFKGITMKDAYMNCSKWIAGHIIAKNNSKNITYNMQKVGSEILGDHRILLTVYVYTDEEEVKDRHCVICKEASEMLYMSGNKHKCESCKIIPYRKRVEEKVNKLSKMIKEELF